MADRLISADALKAELWKERARLQMMDDSQTADKIMHGIYRAQVCVDKQPTVDAVPVVRCKDCIHWSYANEECIYHDFEDHPYGYCAWGERREDVQNV